MLNFETAEKFKSYLSLKAAELNAEIQFWQDDNGLILLNSVVVASFSFANTQNSLDNLLIKISENHLQVSDKAIVLYAEQKKIKLSKGLEKRKILALKNILAQFWTYKEKDTKAFFTHTVDVLTQELGAKDVVLTNIFLENAGIQHYPIAENLIAPQKLKDIPEFEKIIGLTLPLIKMISQNDQITHLYAYLWQICFENEGYPEEEIAKLIWNQSEFLLRKDFDFEEGIADRFSLKIIAEDLKSPFLPLIWLEKLTENVPSYNPKFKAIINKLFSKKSNYIFTSEAALLAAFLDTDIFFKKLGFKISTYDFPFQIEHHLSNHLQDKTNCTLFISSKQIANLKDEDNVLSVYCGSKNWLEQQEGLEKRKYLHDFADKICLLDFHGNENAGEYSPDGEKEEAMFHEKDGFVCLFVEKRASAEKEYFLYDIFGRIKEKTNFLKNFDSKSLSWTAIKVTEPEYYLFYYPYSEKKIYEKFISLKDIFKQHHVASHLQDGKILMRPYEFAYQTQPEMADELFLNVSHQIIGHHFAHTFVSLRPTSPDFFQPRFPHLCYPAYISGEANFGIFEENNVVFSENLKPEFKKIVSNFFEGKIEMAKILAYIYAILHSKTYTETFSYFLRSALPRIPMVLSKEKFDKICALGADLMDLHLGKITPNNEIGKSKVVKNTTIKRIQWLDDKIYLSDKFYFESVRREVWEYKIGLYPVLPTFLGTNKALTMNDIANFEKIIRRIDASLSIREALEEEILGLWKSKE